MLRLFVALELPQAVRDRLAMLQGGVPAARWVRPDNLHLTLRFIGEVDSGVAQDIDTALGRVHAPAFAIAIDGVGSFGTPKRPRALWAGMQPCPPLQFLHDKVDRAVVAAGLAPDDRKFRAHVTLARFKESPGPRLARWLGDNAMLRIGPIAVGHFVLYQSHLAGEGAIYQPLAHYPLRHSLATEAGDEAAGTHGVAHEEFLEGRDAPDHGQADVPGPADGRHGVGE